MLGIPMGARMVPELQPEGSDKKKHTHHVDQHENLKG